MADTDQEIREGPALNNVWPFRGFWRHNPAGLGFGPKIRGGGGWVGSPGCLHIQECVLRVKKDHHTGDYVLGSFLEQCVVPLTSPQIIRDLEQRRRRRQQEHHFKM